MFHLLGYTSLRNFAFLPLRDSAWNIWLSISRRVSQRKNSNLLL